MRQVEMQDKATDPYGISEFQNNNVSYTWSTVKVGWDLKCISINDIVKFGLHFLELHPHIINQYISDLMFEEQIKNIDVLLKNIFTSLNLEFPEKDSSLWNKKWRKWRYCFLTSLVKKIKDQNELLHRVENVYADFGYPIDMTPFIYYMPKKNDVVIHSNEKETPIELVNKLKQFLYEEKIHIEKECDTLPKKIY